MARAVVVGSSCSRSLVSMGWEVTSEEVNLEVLAEELEEVLAEELEEELAEPDAPSEVLLEVDLAGRLTLAQSSLVEAVVLAGCVLFSACV